MGAASVIEGLAARRGVRWAAAAAVLLAAAPSAARAQPGDSVRVEWAANGSLVVLNAYSVRGGMPVPQSVRGLVIERDPAALPDAANHRHRFTNRQSAYASAEGSPFLKALGLSDSTLDALANNGGASERKDQFDVQEWSRLLNQLFEKKEIVEGTHRVIVRPVAEPVASLIAADLDSLFSRREPPILPHLKSALIALSDGQSGSARTASVDFGSVAVEQRDTAIRYVWNYGIRPVVIELRSKVPEAGAAFSVGGDRRLQVHPGESVPVSFIFAPKQTGPRVDTLDFLVNRARVAQATLTGEGVPSDIIARVWNWIAARAKLLGRLLALTLVVLIGWKRGVPRLTWRRKPKIAQPDLRGADGRSGDADVRQRLVTARQAIDELLAELGDESVPPAGGNRPAENLRRLQQLEGERADLLGARSRLEARVGTITAEREGLAGQVRTLEGDLARLTQQVSDLEGVQAENATLRAEKTAADKTLASLRGEQAKLAERLSAVAEVLELSDEMLSDAGWPETQRRLPELRDGGKPRYLWNFEQLVADLTAIFEEIAPQAGEGRLAAAVNAVLGGSNNNAGLRMVTTELERKSLASHLGLGHPRELRTLGAERFYRDFVDRRFRPIIDNIAKLGLYARSRSPEFGMGQRLSREGVDPVLLERALALIETRMRADFGVEVDTVRLFEERFDRSRHDTARHSTLRHTLPDLEASIRRLPSETIYDITSVGLRSDGLGVSVRPVVAWVTSQ